MAATKAPFASGGMTHCFLRWGLSVFFLKRARSSVTGAVDDVEFHNLVLQQPQAPACASLRRFGAGQCNQFSFLLTIKNRGYRRLRALLTAQNRLKALFHQLLARPIYRRGAGI